MGVSTYAYLKQKADEDGRNIDFFYSRYEGHLAIMSSTDRGKETIWKFSFSVMDYFQKYFSEPEQSLDYFEYFGKRYENLPYDVEGKIENTFKEEGENFIEDIGNLNGGADYEKNERNIYDLYIPIQLCKN